VLFPGFKRSTEPKSSPAGRHTVEVFRHPSFVRGRRDLLHAITRKTAAPSPPAPPVLTHSHASSRASTQPSAQSEFEDFSDVMSLSSFTPPALLSDPASAQRIAQLEEQTRTLQQEVATLRVHNALLASQQEQQGLALQSVLALLGRFGIATDITAQAHALPDAPQPSQLVSDRWEDVGDDACAFFDLDDMDVTALMPKV
jgi:hypothetical protein